MSPAEKRAEAWQARLAAAGSQTTVSYHAAGWFVVHRAWLPGASCLRGYDVEHMVAEIEELRRPPPPDKPWNPLTWKP